MLGNKESITISTNKWYALEQAMNEIYKPGLPNIMGLARIDKWRSDMGQS